MTYISHTRHVTVYDWSNEEVVTWVRDVVHTAAYDDRVRGAHLMGKSLARIADSQTYLGEELRITDERHLLTLNANAQTLLMFGNKIGYLS